ncbi:MAG TPA: hypothetical protein VFF13_03955 [archaeon]|nr:hypothetical protein [archaeon]
MLGRKKTGSRNGALKNPGAKSGRHTNNPVGRRMKILGRVALGTALAASAAMGVKGVMNNAKRADERVKQTIEQGRLTQADREWKKNYVNTNLQKKITELRQNRDTLQYLDGQARANGTTIQTELEKTARHELEIAADGELIKKYR